jgi:hypothetical protein
MTTCLLLSALLSASPEASLPVSAELVCLVRDEVAVRWRSGSKRRSARRSTTTPNNQRARSWPKSRCLAVAREMSLDREPRVLLAISVLESDEGGMPIKWVRRGGTDCRLEDCWKKKTLPGDVADVGLCGVRCRLGSNLRCDAGPARGMTVDGLLDPAANVRVARKLLDLKRRAHGANYLARYHGSRSDRDPYVAYVRVLVAAFEGREVKTRKKRVRVHARNITRRVRNEPEARRRD